MKKLMTKERLSAFCDAIIAIIMTILVAHLTFRNKKYHRKSHKSRQIVACREKYDS